MESSTSKVDIIMKPVLRKAGIPLPLPVAGFICAKIVANPSVNLGLVEFLEREASSREVENQRLEKFIGECLRTLEQMEYWKLENGLLQRKLDAREAELLGIHGALETKTKVIKKLENETGELRALLEQLQDEKKGLLAKLGLAEKLASSISKAQEKDNNLETDFEGSSKAGNCGMEHELTSMVVEHNKPCFGNVRSNQERLKRRKLFCRLTRWVERNEKGRGRLDEKEMHDEFKCFGRHSVSDYAEKHHIARRSCSSA
ncbi:uncharacterized protein LOC103964437 [Pyrus x bretschneideri]|uniref:uncharacterized protein LOC103964437 n=1 Tax=Pyrus x bretschneideri TaxID=225117 RepID=UPI0020303AAA|nr:uncharacterized protein LOC103964437 [Pyrus x bretschneideri]